MDKKWILGAGLLTLLAVGAQAQSQPGKVALPATTQGMAPGEVRTPVEYFDITGWPVKDLTYAAFYRQTTLHGDGSGTERLYYYPSGRPLMSIPYVQADRRTRQGLVQVWYQSGQLLSEQAYEAGQRHGSGQAFYPSGKLERKMVFEHGVRLSGASFKRGGKATAYGEPAPGGGFLADIPEAVAAVRRKVSPPQSYPALPAATAARPENRDMPSRVQGNEMPLIRGGEVPAQPTRVW
ncbi:toxin-antitoxin system YwqK family antitoxin [Hymenobacter persicinus]|uniref:Toxin-antitoxin system YwqK family antitoxin n=1 Tax=Hymenobacter persicinus TaxID=2025506 RepID=A0A4Q5LEY8_9BACT|nr:hypothetical protein [Hymenobacter persicinus]RYU83276.1 hypothetical protein EWM57_03025 [Hymenobacter persicinus]